MKIDTNAVLMAKKVTLINAPIHRVWQLQTNINNWPAWQKEISYARLHGKLQKGTIFTWKAMGMGITSELQEVIESKVIGWSGKSFGMTAVHIWKFESRGGKTQVTTEESLSGIFPRIIKFFKPDFLEQSLANALLTLKNQAERTK